MADGQPIGTFRVFGLDHADVAEIEDLLPGDGGIEVDEDDLPSERLGEPATFVLAAALALTSIRVVAAWLQRKRRRGKVRHTVEVVEPDGTRRTETLELSYSESEAPTPELIEKLAALTNLPADQLRSILR